MANSPTASCLVARRRWRAGGVSGGFAGAGEKRIFGGACSRDRPQRPNGASELLIDAAMRRFASEGCDYVTLGLVALAHAADEEIRRNPAWLRILMYFARAHANRFYNFRGLERFRVKMAPERWETIYAISNEPRFSVRSLYAMGGAFSGIAPWAAIAIGTRTGSEGRIQVVVSTRAPAADSAQKAAHPCRLRAELVVARIVKRQDAAQFRREARLRLRPQQRLLVLLLRLVAARVERMQRAARHSGAVRRTAVPGVGIHYYHGPSLTQHQHLIGMRRLRIGQRLLRQLAAALRARARCAWRRSPR